MDETRMSETNQMDQIDLSALLSSRVCHDLINPVGAISSGLSMVDDEDSDAAMREMADELVREGTKKALAILGYARLAYGAAGGYGAEIKLEDAEEVIKQVYETTKADLVWNVAPAMAPKNKVKVLLILANTAHECIPRGGTVTISEIDGGYHFTIMGDRLFLNDDFIAAIAGDNADLKPKLAPAYIAGLLARQSQGQIKAEKFDNKIVMQASFTS